MAKIGVVEAVEARLVANWTNCPVSKENEVGSTPEPGTAFLQVEYTLANSVRISFGVPGANVYREEGVFRLLLQIERGSGSLVGRQWADELETLFLGKHFDGVETFAPQSASADGDNENGQYYTYAVAVPYRFDFLG